jgi:gluconolactonase
LPGCYQFKSALPIASHPSTSRTEWQKKNDALISKYDLKVRELPGVRQSKIESNVEAAKVNSIDNLDSIGLYQGVNAKVFWGSGTIISVLQSAVNSKIPRKFPEPGIKPLELTYGPSESQN